MSGAQHHFVENWFDLGGVAESGRGGTHGGAMGRDFLAFVNMFSTLLSSGWQHVPRVLC